MSFQRERYSQTPGVRIRPVPELGICVVFTPAPPQLFNLNPHAWLILELAPGQTYEELETRYLARVVPPLTDVVARRQLEEGLQQLVRCGIIASRASEPEI